MSPYYPHYGPPSVNCHQRSIDNTERDEQIRERRASGLTYQAIADEFHLSPEFVRHIVIRGPSEAQKRGHLKKAKPKFGSYSWHGG